MKKGFKKALFIFKYLTIIFSIVYWTGVTIDDWGFIKKYWSEHWIEYIENWFMWFSIYFLVFSIYYWIIASVIILIYFKLIPRIKSNIKSLESK